MHREVNTPNPGVIWRLEGQYRFRALILLLKRMKRVREPYHHIDYPMNNIQRLNQTRESVRIIDFSSVS